MSWMNELDQNLSTVEELEQYLTLTTKGKNQLKRVTARHPMSVTRYYMSLIDRADPDDPIRKMIIPSAQELDLAGSYDPSGELRNTKMPGLQHKYSQTVLLLATNRCASYCRYCFRKRLVGLPTGEILDRLNSAATYITEHEEVSNVLVSGGDPFVLSTEVIDELLGMLSPIRHLRFLRFGTRIPIVFPDRILQDEELRRVLKRYSKKGKRIYVVTQFNHPREVTVKAIDALDRLISAGVILNNQTVLLKGVNDDPDVLAQLCSRLVGIGVNPYYVFQCRPVKRVKRQFQVLLRRGYEVVEGAKAKLDGHAKRFRYVMSHATGKIEIVGVGLYEAYLKYHQAKNPKDLGRFFQRKLTWNARWLDDLQ